MSLTDEGFQSARAQIEFEVAQQIDALKEQNRRLRQRVRNQRDQLRVLNDAHLRKNARIDNLLTAMEAVTGMRIVYVRHLGQEVTNNLSPEDQELPKMLKAGTTEDEGAK